MPAPSYPLDAPNVQTRLRKLARRTIDPDDKALLQRAVEVIEAYKGFDVVELRMAAINVLSMSTVVPQSHVPVQYRERYVKSLDRLKEAVR